MNVDLLAIVDFSALRIGTVPQGASARKPLRVDFAPNLIEGAGTGLGVTSSSAVTARLLSSTSLR